MDWKTWQYGKIFSSQEKSGNSKWTGKPKYWKIPGILPEILENEGVLASFYFFSDFLKLKYLLNIFLYK